MNNIPATGNGVKVIKIISMDVIKIISMDA